MIVAAIGDHSFNVLIDVYEAKALVEVFKACTTMEAEQATKRILKDGLQITTVEVDSFVMAFISVLGRYTDKIKIEKKEQEDVPSIEEPKLWTN